MYRRDLDFAPLSSDPDLLEREREEAARILAEVRQRAEEVERERATALPARLLAAAVGGPLVAVALGLAEVGITGPTGAGATVLVHGIPGEHAPESVVAALVHAGVGVAGFEIAGASLEDLFVSLTGEGFDVSN